MVAEEADQSNIRQIIDDDWYAFLEHWPIDEEMKWNFALLLGRQWKIQHVRPIPSSSIADNIIFKSALRRTQNTYDTRRTRLTAKLFSWYDENRSNKLLFNAVK